MVDELGKARYYLENPEANPISTVAEYVVKAHDEVQKLFKQFNPFSDEDLDLLEELPFE